MALMHKKRIRKTLTHTNEAQQEINMKKYFKRQATALGIFVRLCVKWKRV